MSLELVETLAAFRKAHPEIETAEVFITDLNGVARGKLVPIDMLGKIGNGGMRMPTSTLGLDIFSADVDEAAIAIQLGDPDGILVPVPRSLAPMTWAGRPTAQLQCMMGDAAGASLCDYDPRALLARVVARAEEMGYTPVVALELEFYLIDPAEPRPPLNPVAGGRLNRAQIYDLSVMRAFEPVMSDITRAAHALGAPAETAICEFGAGQFELNLRHEADALAAADHMIALKRAIRGAARNHGLDATFMPKPFGDMAGSGQHIHLSLLDEAGRNVFDSMGPAPNTALRHAVAGLLGTMPEAMLIAAPHHNGYRRFMPGSYAPLVAAWGLDNRSVAVRVPETEGKGARLEQRVAGADANPYLLAAVVLAGALAGLERGEEPPEIVGTEAGQGDGPALPLSWAMAERVFAESAFICEWLSPEFQRIFAAMKRQERATILSRVSDVEYDAYLRVV